MHLNLSNSTHFICIILSQLTNMIMSLKEFVFSIVVKCILSTVLLIFFFTGLSSVNPSLWWGIALKSQQTVTNMIAFIAVQECRKTMKIT